MSKDISTSEKILMSMCISVTFLLLLLSSANFVSAQIIIDSENIDIPSSISENTELSVSFSASDEVGDISYRIYRDGVMVSDSDNYISFMDYSSAGRYNFTFFASDNESNASETRVLEVLDVPMKLSLTNPKNMTYNSRVLGIELVTSAYVDECSYTIYGPDSWIDSGMITSYVNLTAGGQIFTGMLDLPEDGVYMINSTCSDGYDNMSVTSVFNIDTVNPVISSKSYSMDASNTVTMTASTDTVCICRYDSSDLDYYSMSGTFSYSNSLQHSTSISGLPEGYYTYYIRCKNHNNIISNAETVSFGIVTKPSASIVLSKSSPLKAGTYEVKLTTSEPVISAPSLYYNFDTDTTARYVTLTGSGRDWKGYMIIEEKIPNKVGTFHYTATDFSNNIGNIVSDGELFLVDTLKPDAPVSIDAEEMSDGAIKIRWYYDGEDASRYNIYRDSGDDPEYVDYIDSTTSKQYIDDDVIGGVTYYYRIAAVDKAGNDGSLSDMVQATSTEISSSHDYNSETASTTNDDTSQNPVQGQVLDVKLVPKVDSMISELEKYLMDIEPVKSDISSINDPNKLKIIEALSLIDDINAAKSTISSLITQLENLKRQNLKQSELDIQLNKLRMDAIKAKSMVAEDIMVVEQSSYDQVTQESDVDAAITEAVAVNLSRKILDNYSDSNNKLQDYILVKTDIIIFKIKYLGKDDYDKYTLVKKTVSSSQEARNLSIIEMIPKSFESKASDILFDIDGQQIPVVVNADPVLRWDIDSLGSKTLYYMTRNNAELLSAKGAKTIVLYRPDFKVTDTVQDQDGAEDSGDGPGLGNMLTGFVGLNPVDVGNVSLVQWMVLIGVGLILGLSAYYISLDKKSKKYAAQRLKDHKIITRPINKPLESKDSVKDNVMPTVSKDDAGKQSARAGVIVNVVNNGTKGAAGYATSAARSLDVSQNKSSNLSPDIVVNLDRVNELINAFDYESARILFNQCLQQYKSVAFKDISDKKTAMLTIDHLYTKLMVYKAIYDSRKHVLNKDATALKKDKDIISKAYSKLHASLSSIEEDYIDSENNFLGYVANSRKHLDKIRF